MIRLSAIAFVLGFAVTLSVLVSLHSTTHEHQASISNIPL
jgi:hypothetical protein